MSRRQSRLSIDERQSDTLLEFENFKKKFLLANKHITKLNSTLSAKIEELNAQISTLYVENLRLRASEIALTSQLKRERDKSRKILVDAETATHALMKHFGQIRRTFGVPHGRTSTPDAEPPQPRARRPIPDPNVSPPPNRLAKPPTVPGIVEDDEPSPCSPTDADEEQGSSPTMPKRRKSKSRPSSSHIPVPTRLASPPPVVDIAQVDFEEQLGKSGKRRPTRRQSGLLTDMSVTTVTTPGLHAEINIRRPRSPILGPAPDDIDDEPLDVLGAEEEAVEAILETVTKRERKERKIRDSDSEVSSAPAAKPRERKRNRVSEDPGDAPDGTKSRLKDVTNSQAGRSSAAEVDPNPDRERQTPESEAPPPSRTRNFLSTPASSSRPPSAQLPTPRSSSPLPQPDPTSDGEALGGRERRVRKSVNYAEPKLNTKMRKPDPAPSSGASKRTSSSGALEPAFEPPTSTRSTGSQPDEQDAMNVATKRKKPRPYASPDDDYESEGTQADAEYGSLGVRSTGSWGNVDARRRSVHSSGARRVEADDIRRHSLAV